MPTDPRLQNTQLLTLAAYRIQQRRQREVPDWRYTTGLASLLDAARRLPQRDPWDLADLEEMARTDGLARMLLEARLAVQQEHGRDQD